MEAHGSHLRAKEATKAYPRRLKKCRPHRARPFGAGLERQHGRRASPTADERLRSYEESRESYRELLVPAPKKASSSGPFFLLFILRRAPLSSVRACRRVSLQHARRFTDNGSPTCTPIVNKQYSPTSNLRAPRPSSKRSPDRKRRVEPAR